MTQEAHQAAKTIQGRAPGARPRIGLILGSGLGPLADDIVDPVRIPYDELAGFPRPTVEGHGGNLVLGTLGSVEVACLQGRVHLYEGHPASAVKTLVRTLKLLGCESLVVTNAAGALNPGMQAGNLMMITDHINFQGVNPLVGSNDEEFGPRFLAMTDAYDRELRERMRAAAMSLAVTLHEGVYMALLGPCFETPAEIRAYAALGANAVGMSTVPEVIVARHCDMRVCGVSVLTNLGAGLADETLSHEQTLAAASKASDKLRKLMTRFLELTASA